MFLLNQHQTLYVSTLSFPCHRSVLAEAPCWSSCSNVENTHPSLQDQTLVNINFNYVKIQKDTKLWWTYTFNFDATVHSSEDRAFEYVCQHEHILPYLQRMNTQYVVGRPPFIYCKKNQEQTQALFVDNQQHVTFLFPFSHVVRLVAQFACVI